MPQPPQAEITTRTKHRVTVYLTLAIGVIIAAITAVIYLFSGK